MVKIDKRKSYTMVLDVETAGTLAQRLTYDIGLAIADKKGNIVEERSFLIQEIFMDRPLMATAYYAQKIPSYYQDLIEGKHELVSFEYARNEIFSLLEKYNVKTFSAYNLNFDLSALKNTYNYINTGDVKGGLDFFEPKHFEQMKLKCIWSYACEVLYSQKSFAKFATDNGFYTEKGNYKTSAEVGYAYMTNNPDFVEEHRGLDDVRIEVAIMARCNRQNKKHLSGILGSPWRLVVNTHGAVMVGA